MSLVGGRIGYLLLKAIASRQSAAEDSRPDTIDSQLKQFFGDDFFDLVRGKVVIDFGCGEGRQAVEMAINGAGRVIGLDIQEKRLEAARELARRKDVAHLCEFCSGTEEQADVIVSKDAFEHFSDPAAILLAMRRLVRDDGYVLASFGPTWLHPYGGHLFSVFPWSHLVFSEASLIRWRADFRHDGATRFSEVEGGLNQLTIRAFEEIVESSPFQLCWLDTVPIKGINLLKSRPLREIGSSIVRCKLTPKSQLGALQPRGTP